MKISGFTIVRNAEKLHFPIKEVILSALPIVDEFIVNLGDCDPDDKTFELINSIQSRKIKIYSRKWDLSLGGKVFSVETNYALSKCIYDWCLYLQADEVLHENDYEKIKNACEYYYSNPKVEGFLFKYYHFWGDYWHYLPFHGWYQNEIRIIKNNSGIVSFGDAQSFKKNNNKKLNVILLDAYIYHYGWVRPPHIMSTKKQIQDSIYHNKNLKNINNSNIFDYGNLNKLPTFKNTHPIVMKDKIKNFQFFTYTNQKKIKRKKFKHEKFFYKLITKIELLLFKKVNVLGGYKNWKVIGKYP